MLILSFIFLRYDPLKNFLLTTILDFCRYTIEE